MFIVLVTPKIFYASIPQFLFFLFDPLIFFLLVIGLGDLFFMPAYKDFKVSIKFYWFKIIRALRTDFEAFKKIFNTLFFCQNHRLLGIGIGQGDVHVPFLILVPQLSFFFHIDFIGIGLGNLFWLPWYGDLTILREIFSVWLMRDFAK